MTRQWLRSSLLAAMLGVGLVGCSDSSGDSGAGAGAGPGGHSGGADAGGQSQLGAGAPASGGAPPASSGAAGTGPSAGAPGVSGASATGGEGGGSPHGGAAGTMAGAPSASSGRDGAGGTAGLGAAGGPAGTSGQPAAGGQGGSAAGGRGQAGRGAGNGGQGGAAGRSISFGTLLDAQAVVSAAHDLAASAANPSSSQWRAKGDQHRTYHFAAAGTDEPYRIYVPTNWDGTASLPVAVFLHGSGSDENSYLDQNNKQMLTLAQQHGYLLVSPLGDKGAYGNFLRLSAPFGDEAGAADLMAQVTADSERTNELSEQDVINVLELVLNEYPVDRQSLFLFGHSMGSGGTWYLGGKYAQYWRGLAPMSGPFVEETGYPWDAVRGLALFETEGTQTPSVDASRLLRDWLASNGFQARYEEVNADHGGMIPLVLPDVFTFFDQSRTK